MTNTLLYSALFSGVAAVALAIFYARGVLAAPRGNERMVELSDAIRSGAMAFMKREYTWILVFVVAMAALIGVLLEDGLLRALAYVSGAILSGAAGLVGMRMATAANARTTEAARTGGIPAAVAMRIPTNPAAPERMAPET